MVNNHRSNEIHKPLRWCLLSHGRASSGIHSQEVWTSRPIISSHLCNISPPFITWIMLCVIIYRNISHPKIHTLYWIHFHCLHTLPLSHLFAESEVQGQTSLVEWNAVHGANHSFAAGNPAPIFGTGALKMNAVYFNSSDRQVFGKGTIVLKVFSKCQILTKRCSVQEWKPFCQRVQRKTRLLGRRLWQSNGL